MKSIFTAVGIDELNGLFKKQSNVDVIDIDIHKQESLWEKLSLDEFKNADAMIIVEMLPGPFSKYELIREIQNQFSGEIFVLLSEDDDEQFISFLRELKITQNFSMNDDPHELIDAVIYEEKEEFDIASSEEPVIIKQGEVEKVYIQKKTIAFVGSGGLGKTTAALQMAELLKQEKYEVCVVDFNLEKADIGKVTGTEEKGIQAVLREEFDEQVIMSNVTTKRNVAYFTGLVDLMDIGDVYKKAKGILKVLKKYYDVVIIDTGNFTHEVTHLAILESDNQIMILNTAERTIKATKKYIDLYNSIGSPLKAVGLMNFYVETNFSVKDIQEVLGIKIFGKIKYDKSTFADIEKGKGFEKSKDKKAMVELKNELFPTKKKSSLFGKGR